MRLRRLAAFTIAVTVLAAGCASPDTAARTERSEPIDASPHPELRALVPESIASKGVIRVGVGTGSPPDEFKSSTGRLVGWEVELIRAAAQTMGLKVEFTEATFDSLIPGLAAERYDAAIGQFGVTGEREKVVDFVSTLSSNELFSARKDSRIRVRGLPDLCGLKVATTRGSREAVFAQQQSPKCVRAGEQPIQLQVYDDSNKGGLALMSGRADVFWLGSTAIEYFVKSTEGEAKVVGSYLDKNPLGFALQKRSPMSEPLRAGVQQLIRDGTYQRILDKWGIGKGAIRTAQVNPRVSAH